MPKNFLLPIFNSHFLKKAGRYSILLGIKESYLFSRNIYGLYVHPFKTLRAIFREKDYSQAILVFSLPFFGVIIGLAFIIVARTLIGAPPQWGLMAKLLFFCSLLFALCSLFYLGYWLYKIKK